MKKKLLLILGTFFLISPVFSSGTNYTDYCPKSPQQSNITISKITGTKWLTEKIAQGIIKKELKKETKGKFKVSLKSRSSGDLINGRFNKLSMDGKNLNLDGTHISHFNSNTLCEFNSVKLNKDSIQFRENMVLDYTIEIDNEALNQTLIDTGYVKTLKSLFPVNDARIEIKNNKLYFIFEIPTYITKPIQLTMSSGITVKNGRIQLSGLKSNRNSLINTSKLVSILEKTNPLAFTSDIMDNKKSKVYIDSVKIVNNVMKINGLVLIPKNTEI